MDRFPNSSRSIRDAGDESHSIRTEGDSLDSIVMNARLSNRLACGGIPQPGASIIAAGQEHVAVGIKCQGTNRGIMLHLETFGLTRGRIPKANSSIPTSRCSDAGIGAECHRGYRTQV